MRRLCALVFAGALAGAMLFSGRAFADDLGVIYSWRSEFGTRDSLTLYERPCAGAALAESKKQANPALWTKFQAAVLVWEGKRYESCWISIGGMVYSIDERGERFGMSKEQPYMPYHLFRPVVGA